MCFSLRSLAATCLTLGFLASAAAAQDDGVRNYTNSDVPTYRPRKKIQRKEDKQVKTEEARPKAAEVPEPSSNQGRRPLSAQEDPAFSTYRPQPQTTLTFKAANLPGAKEIFSFAESAFQSLPERVLRISNYDREAEQWNVYHVKVSDIVCREARVHDIDPLIIEIIIGHESAFQIKATSGAGARGLMQLMPETASQLGVTDIDDPAQNIAAGTRYFAEQYRRFGNLHLALAAYNAGPGAVVASGGVPPYNETINYASSIAQEYQNRRKKRRVG